MTAGSRFPWKGHPFWLAVVFFLVAGAPGFWVPALSNILINHDLGAWKEIAVIVPFFASMVSPMIFGAMVDQRFEAQKVLGWIMLVGSVFLFLSFHAIEAGWGGWAFMIFMGMSSLVMMPAWSLVNTIALSSLDNPEKSFGFYRVWGTIGWMIAGVVVSWLVLDLSPTAGKVAAGIRVVAGLSCFFLAPVKPKGGKPKNLGQALGFGAFGLLRERDHAAYFLAAFLFHIPLASYYLHTPIQLKEMGVTAISATMATGQILEVVAMIGMGYVISKFRVKAILFTALLLGVLRYVLCGLGDMTAMIGFLIIGVMIHGVTWTFFVEAGRVFIDKRVDSSMKGQAQALLAFVTGGFGGVLGVVVVAGLHRWLVEAPGAPGWAAYWGVLSVICVAALLIFGLGYQGLPKEKSSGKK